MKIVYSGDNHLDYKQYNLEERRNDFDRSFLHVATRAIELQADVFVSTGDIFESVEGDSSKRVLVKQAVTKMQDAGIKVIGIRGNHDCNHATMRLCGLHPLADKDTFDVFGSKLPGGAFEATDADGFTLRFVGMDYAKQGDFDEEFTKFLASFDKADVAVLHQTISQISGIFSEVTGEELAARLSEKGVKYIMLGHIHDRHVFDISGVRIGYAGSTEMTDIDEGRVKSFEIVTWDKDGYKTVFEKLPVRPIKQKVLTTVEGVNELLADISSETSLLVVDFCTNLKDHVKFLKAKAKEFNIPLRLTPFDEELIGEDGVHETVKWDREKNSIHTGLKDLVRKSYKPESAEYAMIMNILDHTESADVICREFVTKELGNG